MSVDKVKDKPSTIREGCEVTRLLGLWTCPSHPQLATVDPRLLPSQISNLLYTYISLHSAYFLWYVYIRGNICYHWYYIHYLLLVSMRYKSVILKKLDEL